MGALRTRMIEEMKLRNFSPRTQQSYLAAVIGLVKHYRRSPDHLTQDEIRAYLLHLEKRGLSPGSRNVTISGMKFFYHQMLGWNDKQLFIPPRKRSWQLPEVLGQKEFERLLLAAAKQRDRCLLMTAYATGLRVSELVRLKIGAIDSERMMVRVGARQGQKRPLHDLVSPAAHRAALVLERTSFTDLPVSQPKGRSDIDRLRPANLQSCQAEGRHPKRPRHPYAQALFCYASTGSRGGSANHSDAAGP